MNTARIMILTIAPGAGVVAAYRASGSDNKSVPAEPASNARARQTGTLALRSIADLNAAETMPDDTSKRSDSANVVRYGVASSTTITK